MRGNLAIALEGGATEEKLGRRRPAEAVDDRFARRCVRVAKNPRKMKRFLKTQAMVRAYSARAAWRELLRVAPTKWQLLQLIERAELLAQIEEWFIFRDPDTGRRFFATKEFQSQWLIPGAVRSAEREARDYTIAQRRGDESDLTHTILKSDGAGSTAPWECWACMCTNAPESWPSCATCGHSMRETSLHVAGRDAKSASAKAAKMAALRGQKASRGRSTGGPQDRVKHAAKEAAEKEKEMKVLRRKANAAFGRKHLDAQARAMQRDAVSTEITAEEARRWLYLPLLEGRLSAPIVQALASIGGVTLRGGKVVDSGRGTASPIGFGERGGAGIDASPGMGLAGMDEDMLLVMTPDGMTPAEAVAAGLFFTPDNGEGRRILPSRAMYSGSFVNKLFDGHGEMKWPAPMYATYTGQWRKGEREGEGVLEQLLGGPESGRWLRYEGQWSEGVRHGTGEVTSSNGEHFGGEFCKGKMTGDGMLTTATGDVYEGQWKNGRYDGVGTFSMPSVGYVYRGELVNGEAQGTGVEQIGTGEVYRGQFHNDRRQGKGAVTYPNGDSFRGQWFRGQFSGVGEYITVSGSVYRGQWEANKRRGFGKALLANGDAYSGQWKADVAEGDGACYFASTGDTYTGRWHNGLRHGRGCHVMGTPHEADAVVPTVQTPAVKRIRSRRHSSAVTLPRVVKARPLSLKLQRRRHKHAAAAAAMACAAADAAAREATECDMTPDEMIKYRIRVERIAHRERFEDYFRQAAQDAKRTKGVIEDASASAGSALTVSAMKVNDVPSSVSSSSSAAELTAAAVFQGRFDGMWFEGVANGKGQMWFENGDHYRGQWVNARAEGKGLCTFASGSIYKGEWRNGDIEGEGELNAARGHVYVGQWVGSKKHGEGKLTMNSGTIFIGEFRDDAMGSGKLIYNPNNIALRQTYEGNFKHVAAKQKTSLAAVKAGALGQRHGEGTYVYPDGSKYSGQWERGIRHGIGTYIMILQVPSLLGEGVDDVEWSYTGAWKDDVRTGQGKEFDPRTGETYTGEFVKNARHGRGALVGPDGETYEGGFVHGNKHGKGQETLPPPAPGMAPVVFQGRWENGEKLGLGVAVLRPDKARSKPLRIRVFGV